ncbi:predicted protein [Nematostella vectensis]|uniref:Group XV phospholipase A2 n=1 Tax=Nematostella vectensis TaxID=45351 RepID=A7SQQ2_NEMVE|nr:phospholipase A2 group XV [Nematostella vectensis]EDO33966.1 predicted protein [Nematostella vectensis]|eukprot:XP_001626066.1 predicted protein [Nematostella vectensis]
MTNRTLFLVISIAVIVIVRGRVTREQGSSAQIKNPVVIVPGTGGSQIEAKLNKPTTKHWYCHNTWSDYFTLWLQESFLLPMFIDCWVDNMRLVYDPATKTVHNSPGVETRVPGFGDTNTIEYLDKRNLIAYFAPLVKAMVSWGYERGKNLRAAPYDFRYAPDSQADYYIRLRQLIEDTYTQNGEKQVTLLSHSLGCPYTLVFLNQQSTAWKDKYIKQWVALSGVWGGTTQLVRLFASGDAFGIPLVNPLTVRVEQRTCSSNNFMLPSRELWRSDEVLVTTPDRKYTVRDFEDYFRDVGYPDGIPVRRNLENLTAPLLQHAPNVTLHCLHGSGVDTEESYTYGKGEFPDEQPTIRNGDGDGTVNARSLRACATWVNRQGYDVVVKDYAGVNHNGILSDAKAQAYIKSIVIN